ncbi:MAG: PorT family protein [Saprospiraceae bacterium]|nr:PorT family protein [Saprospiraceae bacterium]
MQINPEEQFDETFVDLAWSQMNTILDREMPTKEKKRKFFWIWLLTVGLLCSSGALLYWFYPQLQLSPSKTNPPTPPIAQQNTTSVDEICEDTALSLLEVEVPNDAAVSRSGVDKFSAIVREINQNTAAQFDEKISVESNEVKTSYTIASDTSFDSVSSNHANPDISVAPSAKTVALLLPLPMNDSPILTFSTPSVSFPLTTTPNKSLQSWNVGVEIGGFYQSATNAGGYAGAYLAYQLQPRWNIDLGINYVRLESEISPLEVGLSGSQERMLINSNDFFSVAQVDSLIGKTVTTAYLQIPLQINYRIRNHWKVSAGATYWIDIRSEEQKTLEKFFYADNQNFVTNSLPEKTALEVASFQFSIQGGLSYQFTPHWSVTATYQRIITTEKNSLIGLGTQYEW